MSATAKKPTPTFYVFRKDGSKNPEIKTYFLENMDLDAHTVLEQRIKLADGTLWELILEDPVKAAFKQSNLVKCLVSFQARIYGNYAIARLYDPSKKGSKAKGDSK